MPRPLHTRAFTLIEMLLVVAIIGILVTMLAPRLQMLGGPRSTAAARVLTQMTRYARTMALLHQVETELSVSPNGALRVSAAGAPAAAPADEGTAMTAVSDGAGLDVSVAGANAGSLFMGGGADADPAAADAAAAPAAEDDIAVERQLDSVTVTFLGYTDAQDDETLFAAEGDPEARPGRVRFRSNGTCRPHRYKLTDATGVTLVVAVDLLGMATVLSGEEAR